MKSKDITNFFKTIHGSWISNMLNFSMRFPLEFYDGFDWFKNPSGSFACWFRYTKPFFNFLFSWGTFPSAKIMDILVIISLLAGPRGAQNFSIGLTLESESYDHKSFPKFKTFTLSRSKVWILPMLCWYIRESSWPICWIDHYLGIWYQTVREYKFC